jgi:peptidoglycan hydrolase-like protein with peptidoglycan-binding domain
MSDPIQPWPVVRQGDEGHPVLTLQELLRAHGHPVSVDGDFGPQTAAAVKAVRTAAALTADGDGVFGPKTDAKVRGFQDALDIVVDGVVGPITWRALVSGMLSF